MTFKNFKGETLISEAYDEKNDITGFMIQNTADPLKRKKAVITLNFENATSLVVYRRGKPETVALKDGNVTLKLPCADGCFVIPCK